MYCGEGGEARQKFGFYSDILSHVRLDGLKARDCGKVLLVEGVEGEIVGEGGGGDESVEDSEGVGEVGGGEGGEDGTGVGRVRPEDGVVLDALLNDSDVAFVVAPGE